MPLNANRPRKAATLVAAGLICLAVPALSQWDDPPNYPDLWEMDVLGGNWLGDKEIGYFKLTVTDWYFSGVEYLAIQATQDSFGSDPDLFISRVSIYLFSFRLIRDQAAQQIANLLV